LLLRERERDMGRFGLGAVVGAVAVGMAGSCWGAVIQMANPSFETPGLADGAQAANVPGWVVTSGSAAVRDPAAGDVLVGTSVSTVGPSSTLSTDGDQLARVAAGSVMYVPLLGYTFANGQSWQVSVDVAWPSDGTQGTMRVARMQLTTADQLGSWVPAGAASFIGFSPSVSVTGWTTIGFNVTLSNAAAFVGKVPVIALMTPNSTESMYFDNVRGTTTATYDESAVPEPGAVGLVVGAVGVAMGRRPRQV
jgi:hypothetical protein